MKCYLDVAVGHAAIAVDFLDFVDFESLQLGCRN